MFLVWDPFRSRTPALTRATCSETLAVESGRGQPLMLMLVFIFIMVRVYCASLFALTPTTHSSYFLVLTLFLLDLVVVYGQVYPAYGIALEVLSQYI